LPVLSEVHGKLRNFEAVLKYDLMSLDLATESKDSVSLASLLNNIGFSYMQLGSYESAIENFELSIELSQSIRDTLNLLSAKENLNQAYAEQGLAEQSLAGNLETLEIHRKSGDQSAIAKTTYNVGLNYKEIGEVDSALLYLNEARTLYTDLGNLSGLSRSLIQLAEINLQLGNYDKALEQGKQAQAAATKSLDIELLSEATLDLYAIYNNIGDAQSALDMFTYYINLRDSVRDMEEAQKAIQLQYKYNYEKRALKDSLEFANQQAIMDYQLGQQQAELEKQRIGLFSAAGGLLLILALAFSIYRGKKRSDNLLLNILPAETAKELKKKGFAEARQYEEATVLFTDFKEFTEISEGLSPEQLVETIDECFKAFDEIVAKYNIEKIKTIGDSYMAAGGLPVPDSVKPKDVVKAALEMRDWMLKHKVEKGEKGFEMRVGIHTGPVVAGIVGVKKFLYDIWGDTVNTASRMESNGEVNKVNISQDTYDLIKNDPDFIFESRGKIEVKGKGEVEMYFVKMRELES
jgi:class 3 adenylate cyclase